MDSQSLINRQREYISSLRISSPNVLHLAVALGLPSFVREIVDRNPELAFSLDEDGLTPCQLAVANGYISVVKELLDSKVGIDICCSRDMEGNTLLHIAAAKRQKEIIKMLVGKVDFNAINLNGSTALDILLELGHEHDDMTVKEMTKRVVEHDPSEPNITKQQSGESENLPSSLKEGTNIVFHRRENLFNFRRALIRRAPNDKDRETSNTLMIVATLISTISFQSALNPPGGFIQGEKNTGMAVLEGYLTWYLLFDMVAFISSLSVILLTVYIVPKWTDLIKLAMFVIWISIFFTFFSFHLAIFYVYSNIIYHPLIQASLSIGYGIMFVFAFLMLIYTWYLLYQSMSTFLSARLSQGMVGRLQIIVIACIAFLGAAVVWLPFVLLDVSLYYNMF